MPTQMCHSAVSTNVSCCECVALPSAVALSTYLPGLDKLDAMGDLFPSPSSNDPTYVLIYNQNLTNHKVCQ